jgi:hypothetical protein
MTFFFCLRQLYSEFSLWHFHVYMYYNLNWFISSIFLLSTLAPFLWWFQLVLKFYIHSSIEGTSTIFTFFTSFFYPTPLICDLPLVWPPLSVTCFS